MANSYHLAFLHLTFPRFCHAEQRQRPARDWSVSTCKVSSVLLLLRGGHNAVHAANGQHNANEAPEH
jgi:hypothetical protein